MKSRAHLKGPSMSYSSVNQNISGRTFPSSSVNTSQSPNELFLPNPWDDPQSRHRVSSINERPYRPPETPNIPSTCDPNTSLSFPEPQLNPQPPLAIASPSPPVKDIRRRHSTADFRPPHQPPTPGVPLHQETSSRLPHQGTEVLGHRSEYRDETGSHLSSTFPNTTSDEKLLHFQSNTLADREQEWHCLAPKEAREALGKKEVRRQSIIFEVIKGERDYVADLEVVQQLFIDGLHAARPRIIPENELNGFIQDIFGNILEILAFHRQLLDALLERQREQHPLLQTVADIILDSNKEIIRTEFRSAYETYIKHYPLAESYHRKELKRNGPYEQFTQSLSSDPRVRKRDLVTFLARPVTRLPRLSLLLEELLKSTEKEFEHPDLEALPLILEILKNCVKSTQPGIEAAEGKVQFWSLSESLVYRRGEIIDMDLYDQSRTLVYSSPVSRRMRSDSGFLEWDDLTATLLDNYFLLTKEERQPNSLHLKQNLLSRPLHLSFLRLGNFDDTPEMRREKHDGGILDSLRSHLVPIFPFTVYHASSRSTRRYTLFVTSEAQRQKWKNTLSEAISLHQLRGDASKWFEPQNTSSSFFRALNPNAAELRGPKFTGRITSAVPFTYAERKFLVVGCRIGIFVSVASQEAFKKVLPFSDPIYMSALQTVGHNTYNRLVIYSESIILSYSLELLARFALGQTTAEMFNASKEQIGDPESNITFCRCVQIGSRALVIYASKRRLSSTLNLQIMEAVGQAELERIARKNTGVRALAFKPFGEAGFVPRDAFDVTALTKNIGICTRDGIVIADPTNLGSSNVTVVPDLRVTASSPSMSMLKERLKDAKPLGLTRIGADELLVIYDLIGFYITKQGVPSHSCEYLRWETQANAFARRGNHILLLSSQFIEIRNINTGKIVQVIEGADIRLMYGGGYKMNDATDRILVAMRGTENEKDGSYADRLVELVETVEYVPQTPASVTPDMWDDQGI